MRIIVCGGRDYDDADKVAEVLTDLEIEVLGVLGTAHKLTLVHGAARGADRIAAYTAQGMGWRVEAHPAQWEDCTAACPPASRHRRYRPGSLDEYCPWAGYRRNREMAVAGAALLVAFPGGRGTAHMVTCAVERGIPVREVAR